MPEVMKQGLALYHVTPTAVDRPGWTLPAFSRDEIPLFERRGQRTFLKPLSPSKAGVDRIRLGSSLDHEDKRVWVAGSLEDALLKVRRREGKKHDLSKASPAYTIVMIFPSHPLYGTFDNALTTACANLGEGGSSLHPILIDDLDARGVPGIGLVELSMAGGAKARKLPQVLGMAPPSRPDPAKPEPKNTAVKRWMIEAMAGAVKAAAGVSRLDGCYFHVSPFKLDEEQCFNKRGGKTYIEADTPSHVDAAARALDSNSPHHDPTFGWWSTSLLSALDHVVPRRCNSDVTKYTLAILFPAHEMHETFVLKRRSCRHRGGGRARCAHDKTCVRDGGELGRRWWAENASRYGRAGPRRALRRNRALRTNRRNRPLDSPSPNHHPGTTTTRVPK